MGEETRRQAEKTVIGLLSGREGTICPSEVARKMEPEDWRPLMDLVREVGADLAEQGRIEVLQRGKVVEIRTAKGPVRFARGPNF